MTKKFSRRIWNRYSKLGKGRKKKRTWRKPKGRDNKMREKRKGYPAVVSIGYQKQKSAKKQVKVVRNLKDLETVRKDQLVIIGNVGKRKKIEIAKKALAEKITVLNLDIKKFLKEVKKETERKEKKEKPKEEKKQVKEKGEKKNESK